MKPYLEQLEDRTVPYALSGYSWADHSLTASYLPDGTPSEGYTSSLFAELDAIAPTETWQGLFETSLDQWANATLDLAFTMVPDDGIPSGTVGDHGQIRLAAHPMTGYVAYAYYPQGAFDISGDVFLNSDMTFNVDGFNTPDLYTVFLHELGHALGLAHSSDGSSVMFASPSIHTALSADDIAGIQAIYGAPLSPDLYEPNDTMATAHDFGTVTGINQSGLNLHTPADTDWFSMRAKRAADYQFQASGQTLSVYNEAGQLLATGTNFVLHLNKNQKVFIQVLGGTEVEYTLNVTLVH